MPSTNVSPKCTYIGGVASQLCRLIDKFSFLEVIAYNRQQQQPQAVMILFYVVCENLVCERCVLGGGLACFSASH